MKGFALELMVKQVTRNWPICRDSIGLNLVKAIFTLGHLQNIFCLVIIQSIFNFTAVERYRSMA